MVAIKKASSLPGCLVVVLSLLAVLAAPSQPTVQRYRVEQVFRLETVSRGAAPRPGQLALPRETVSVEGTVRMVLEVAEDEGEKMWRFLEVETEGPRVSSSGESQPEPGVARAVELALQWMKRAEGKEYRGSWIELPVLPLGEAEPRWLTAWLAWAQSGGFSGTEGSPVELPAGAEGETAGGYELEWLRSEFRQAMCHVQRARWTAPIAPAADSVSPELATEGVEARTHFAAQSLEWVTQESPQLVYAERSGVRETYWDLSKVSNPELRAMVFRLRLGVDVRVERIP